MVNFSQIIKKQKQENVFIGLPVHQSLEAETARSLFNMVFSTPNVGLKMNFRTGTLIDRARSQLALQALEGDQFDYMLFVDGDMIFPEDSLTRLLAHKKDIVTAFATTRHMKRVIPVVGMFKYDDQGEVCGVKTFLKYPKDKLFKVDSCGMALTLISTKALKKILEAEPGRGLFQQIPLKNGSVLPEDTSFCLRAKKAGYQVYCDASLSIGHKGTFIYTELDYEANFEKELTKQFGDMLP